jgi:hypothetical protein
VKSDLVTALCFLAGVCIFGIGIVMLSSSMARADGSSYSCSHVREFVGRYGRIKALVLARSYGITGHQLRMARACL